MTRYLLGAIGILLLVSAGLGWWLSKSLTRAGTIEAERDSYQQALESYQGSIEKRDKLLVERGQERLRAQQEAERWRRKWREVQRDSVDCKAWADGRLPDCVIELLQQPGPAGPEGAGTGSTTPANP